MSMNTQNAKPKTYKDILQNPVLWAKACLITVDNKTKKQGPWNARWYQAETLMDKSKQKVLRWGRRLGEC